MCRRGPCLVVSIEPIFKCFLTIDDLPDKISHGTHRHLQVECRAKSSGCDLNTARVTARVQTFVVYSLIHSILELLGILL